MGHTVDCIEQLQAYHEAGHALAFIAHRVPISGAVIGHNSAGERCLENSDPCAARPVVSPSPH
jgi:hypothetical protein